MLKETVVYYYSDGKEAERCITSDIDRACMQPYGDYCFRLFLSLIDLLPPPPGRHHLVQIRNEHLRISGDGLFFVIACILQRLSYTCCPRREGCAKSVRCLPYIIDF